MYSVLLPTREFVLLAQLLKLSENVVIECARCIGGFIGGFIGGLCVCWSFSLEFSTTGVTIKACSAAIAYHPRIGGSITLACTKKKKIKKTSNDDDVIRMEEGW